MADFLLEIGVEEIPARMLDGAREELKERLTKLISAEGMSAIATNSSAPRLEAFSTPRRLSFIAYGILDAQANVEEQLTGPSVNIAYKDGAPTPAAEAFAKKAGVKVNQLGRITTAKGEYISASAIKVGRRSEEVLLERLPKEIASINWPKSMYWRGKSAERFVRPVRWITALLDGEVIPLQFAGIVAGAESQGHRILSKGAVRVKSPSLYKVALSEAKVLVDPAERLASIRKALDEATRTVPGARWREDVNLLATVVNLVEFPSVILGGFDAEYLQLPQEVLVTVMRDHQKYFALEDAQGKLLPHFLAVLNTDGDPDGLIRHGNERVLRARFNDARFFWHADQKIPLKDRVEMLKAVTFQKELGSYFDKSSRVAQLADVGGADFDIPNRKINRDALHQAAWLAKTDLTTELVKEFTELQGIVGGLYARSQGLSTAIADAIYDHYKPLSTEDAVPRTGESAILAIADKADTIAGMFALGLQPTGSKDPFALRRQANGIIKIAVEHKLSLDLATLFKLALEGYKGSEAAKKFNNLDQYAASVSTFFRERLEFYLRESGGFAYDEINAVLAVGSDRVNDVLARVMAVRDARKTGYFESIAVAFKRTKNILTQASQKGYQVGPFKPELSSEVEVRLFQQIQDAGAGFSERVRHRHYAEALTLMANLRVPIDQFFDNIMVMVEEEDVRTNRLGLLQDLVTQFSSIADFSEIVTEKK